MSGFELAFHLASKDVEELCRTGEVADLNVVFGAGLEEAFEACRGVLGALAFVAVGKEHDDATEATPLRFGTGDELVDDDLRTVDEVSELGFPDAEHLREVEGVAVVETEDGGFGKQRVMHAEHGLFGCEVEKVGVAFSGLGIVDDSVAVAEGAALGVLSANTYGCAVEQ